MQEIVVSYKYIIMYFLPLRLSLLLLSSHHLLPTAPSSSSSSFGPWLRLSSSSSSAGKESACNAGDPSSILGSGRSLGERIGYLFQYSWASLVAQMCVLVSTQGCVFKRYIEVLVLVNVILSGDEDFADVVKMRSYCSKVQISQSCLTLCDPMDYVVHGILQARLLEWVAIPLSRILQQGEP